MFLCEAELLMCSEFIGSNAIEASGYLLYFLTSGASSPELVKPTAEGGGLFLLVFFCYISLFSRC
jgi:hypothetical protein